MSEADIQEIQFETPEAQDYEVVTVAGEEDLVEKPAEAAPAPEGVTLTKEQYEALLKGGGNGDVLANGLNRLAETLAPQQQQQVPVPEVDVLKLEDEALKPGQFVKTVEQIANKVAAQQTAQYAIANQVQEKKLLELDPKTQEIYKKYEAEIEKKVQALPPQYRFQPGVYTQIYRGVMQEHQEDIINDRAGAMAQKIAEQAVAEALKKAGIKTPSSSSMYAETGGSTPVVRPKTALRITERDVQNMKESQMNPKDPDQVRSYLEWKKERGIK